eukprot:1273858-Lingulodinium_polyedra.AAC.1
MASTKERLPSALPWMYAKTTSGAKSRSLGKKAARRAKSFSRGEARLQSTSTSSSAGRSSGATLKHPAMTR